MHQNELRSQNEGPISPDLREQQSFPVTSSSSNDLDTERFTEYEFIDSRELARRLTVPASWIRDQVRARSESTPCR